MANALLLHELINANHEGGISLSTSYFLPTSSVTFQTLRDSWTVAYIVFGSANVGIEHILLYSPKYYTRPSSGIIIAAGAAEIKNGTIFNLRFEPATDGAFAYIGSSTSTGNTTNVMVSFYK